MAGASLVVRCVRRLSKLKMSLWPLPIPEFNCPCDLTKVLARQCAERQAAVFIAAPVVSGSNGCRGRGYQPATAFVGSVSNTLSAGNLSSMLDTIASARLGAALGQPCASELPRRRGMGVRAAVFCPSIEMYRRQ